MTSAGHKCVNLNRKLYLHKVVSNFTGY